MSLQRNQPAQVSGQVSSQNVTAVPAAAARQTGDPAPNQLPIPNPPQNFQNTTEHSANARKSLQKAILTLFMERRQQLHEEPPRRLLELVRRLEECLFKNSTTLDEYLDRRTLPSRLQAMVKRMQMNNMNHQLSHVNSCVPVGTMIPTPGFQQTGDSNLDSASSIDSSTLVPNNITNRILPSSVNAGSSFPTRLGTSGSVQGASVSGYQQPSPSISVDAMRNGGVQKMTSQMIPTPGLTNSNAQEANRPVNIITPMNLGSSSNMGSSPNLNSSAPSQPLRQRQHVSVGQGNPSPNLGRNLASGDQSSMKQKAYGSSNGAFTGGLGMMRNNTSIMNGAGTTRGDGSGSGNMHIPVVSSLESATAPSLDDMLFQSTANANNPLINNSQPNTHTAQQTNHLPQHHQYQHSSDQFQGQKLAQNPVRQSQSQLLSKGDTSVQSHLAHNSVTVCRDAPLSQCSNPFQSSDAKSQFQRQKSMTDHSGATRILSHPLDANSQGNRGFIKPDMEISVQEYAVSQNLRTSPLDNNIHDVAHTRVVGPERIVLSSQQQGMGQLHKINETEGRSYDDNRQRQYRNQQKWLLFLRHARQCSDPDKCKEANCSVVRKLLKHMENCNDCRCSYPRCRATWTLVNHHKQCQDNHCPVCIPVKNRLQAQLRSVGPSDTNPQLQDPILGQSKTHDRSEIGQTAPTSCSVIESTEELQPSTKRMKIEQGSQSHVSEKENVVPLDNYVNEHQAWVTQHAKNMHNQQFPVNSEIPLVKVEVSESAEPIKPIKKERLDDSSVQGPEVDLITSNNPSVSTVKVVVQAKEEMEQVKPGQTSLSPGSCLKSGKPNITGVSLIELFTPEQVHQHIMSLRQWIGQSKAKAEKNQAMEHFMSENSCQLCAVEKLTFEPPPIYCTPCGVRIKRNAVYYEIGTGETRHCFCAPCFHETRGERVMVDGNALPKARAEKKKNDEEIQEWWVQCDKCELWQHQICALFNGRRNDGGQAEYTCPNCYIAEIERGERIPLPQSAVLGAKDLPRTNLSDHLEQRLCTKLQLERQERARVQGRSYEEVPGAEELVVRVVSSVDKRLDVKPRFLGIFQEENYAKEFPYKSKVVLLFQKIEGVEVCLFGMYVQEYGSDCQQPNHRRVYLAYLDSVKYFRPDVKAVTGEALRTFVYHEILIGYLEHCKMRGFTSCYIWACPPLKGEDYILYCHPEIQKTPKSDKLREWYLAMLRKATKENIVVELTNMYEHFFVSSGECKAKVTAARLPYFDGDYWPGAAEDIIYQLQEVEDGKKPVNKGNFKKSITKRTLKASGQTDVFGNASKDLLLMQKLGETISPMKEDFIMVHLQHSCAHCCILIASGNSWVCEQCKKFNLCDKCYDAEMRRDHREKHPINQRDKHKLYPVEVTGIADETNDTEIVESEFFDTRQAFLGLCQGNHYQYDTLRRAKHSSMMVLYHLHNPTAPAFVTACSVCRNDIEAGKGWRCETCPDYEACNSCYQKDGLIDHPHKLIKPSRDNNAQNKEARQLRVMQLKKMLELLVHASRCRSPLCQYPNCRKVKALFRHGMACNKRASGGCVLCKKMWHLLQLHARACKESECTVPRCSDLKEHLRRLQQQSDMRRRAAVNEMMRQRMAEVSGKS